MGYIIRYTFNHDNGTTQIHVVDMNISKACDEVYTCMLGGGSLDFQALSLQAYKL